MKRILVYLLMGIALAVTVDAQQIRVLRRGRMASAEPRVDITTPTSGSTYSTSLSTISIGGVALPGPSAIDRVTVQCSGATTLAETNAVGTLSWLLSNIGINIGETVCFAKVYGVSGPSKESARLTITRAGDIANPSVSIITNNGSNFATVLPVESVEVACSDDVACTSMQWGRSTGGSGGCVSATFVEAVQRYTCDVPLALGANIVTYTGKDAQNKSGTASHTITYDPPLVLLPSSESIYVLPAAREGSTRTTQLSVSGATGAATYGNNGAGTTVNDADADCAGITVNSSGLVTMAPPDGVDDRVCTWTGSAIDSDTPPESDTQAYSITVRSATAESRNTFWTEVNALPDCTDANVGTICKQKNVRFNSQTEINGFTADTSLGDDPANNDYVTYDSTVDMAKVAIPVFVSRVGATVKQDAPATSLLATDTCLRVGSGTAGVWESRTPWVIGDYPTGVYEVVQTQNSTTTCHRNNNLVPITRGVGGTTAREWANGTVMRQGTKKLGAANKVVVPLGATPVDSASDPDGGCGLGCTTYLFVWDIMWHPSSMGHRNKEQTSTRNIPQGKTFALRVDGPVGVFVQPQVMGRCDDAGNNQIPGCTATLLDTTYVGTINLRKHCCEDPGGVADWSLTRGDQYCSKEDCPQKTTGSDAGFTPQIGQYLLTPMTIARYFVYVEAKYDDYDKTTLWIHDENRATALLIQNNLLLSISPDAGCQAAPPAGGSCTPVASPNRFRAFEVWYDISSYADFTARDEDSLPGYDPYVSWFSNLSVIRGLTRAQVEADYITRRPVR